jgi:hypothetical protein
VAVAAAEAVVVAEAVVEAPAVAAAEAAVGAAAAAAEAAVEAVVVAEAAVEAPAVAAEAEMVEVEETPEAVRVAVAGSIRDPGRALAEAQRAAEAPEPEPLARESAAGRARAGSVQGRAASPGRPERSPVGSG